MKLMKKNSKQRAKINWRQFPAIKRPITEKAYLELNSVKLALFHVLGRREHQRAISTIGPIRIISNIQISTSLDKDIPHELFLGVINQFGVYVPHNQNQRRYHE